VAALELALSLTFLVPLMMGMLDFGYYFYVGTNAEEAARAGVRALVNAGTAKCGTPGALTAMANELIVPTLGPGPACNGGAAYCYMNEPPLLMGGLGGPTTVTVTCTPSPPEVVDPTWTVQVQVDFVPSTGFFRNMMPAGTAPGTVRYRATSVATN
jgi:TadE-like protein